ncbi:histidine--tRNA ligase [Candidatus Woesearchaeota archaeon]|nr:histidine--tRNA ligase [Candidatus Woesearchaeota archaeon]
MAYKAVKGTRDFYPEIMEPRKRMFEVLRSTAERYGFKEIDSPAVEELKLLTAKSGDEIKSQIFVMEKRSNEEIGLRFDLTVPATRMFIDKQKAITKPVKWYYIAPMWRYEQPQKGRLREFYQFGVELFGSDKVQADAEVISLAIDNLVGLGLKEKDFVIKINSRECLESFFKKIGIKDKDIDSALRVIDKKAKISPEEFEKELEFLGKSKKDELLDYLESNKIPEELNEVFDLLKAMGKEKYVEYSPEIARGLAYYTGIVFECSDRSGKYRAILGGGRYDKMVEQFGGQPCPATGFAMGDVVIELFLKDKGLWKDENEKIEYYVAPVSKEYVPKAFEIANNMREKGKKVEIDLMDKKLGKQFNYADGIGAQKVIVVGDETKSGKVKMKEMKTGKESEILISKL